MLQIDWTASMGAAPGVADSCSAQPGAAAADAWMNGFLRRISIVAAGQADNGDREAH